jgi:hypothetical protein
MPNRGVCILGGTKSWENFEEFGVYGEDENSLPVSDPLGVTGSITS